MYSKPPHKISVHGPSKTRPNPYPHHKMCSCHSAIKKYCKVEVYDICYG